MAATENLIRDFSTLSIGDIAIAGGKNASLGEMLQQLAREGVRVPQGFAITAGAYRQFIRNNQLEPAIRARLELWCSGEQTLQQTGAAIRTLILAGELPESLKSAVTDAYTQLEQQHPQEPNQLSNNQHIGSLAVAVRSSATAEDLPEASFAGQQATYLNVRGQEALLLACKQCYASLFTDRAITYRDAQNFDHLSVAISVGVQIMVRADTGSAGVIFTLDTETAFPDAAVISATWGLGEAVVQGRVIPDKYQVYKPLLKKAGISPIFEKSLGSKLQKLVYIDGGGTEWQSTSTDERDRQVLSDADILQLARWACRIEEHYGRAMDIEWAKDGVSGELFIVQARPETSASQRNKNLFSRYHLQQTTEPLLTGAGIGSAITSGQALVLSGDYIDCRQAVEDFPTGAILVAERTDPDWLPLMRRARGVVTDSGGPTSHAAIVCRELKIPALVGTGVATQVLHSGDDITLSCAGADEGQVYRGLLDYDQELIELDSLPAINTQLMINSAIPGAAGQWWQLPIDGIGLVRIEYIISALIGAHPLALLQPENVSDQKVRKKISQLSRGFTTPAQFYIDTLALGIARIAASQYPKPVIVRFSDFKTNEYRHLIGGEDFEPEEANPMLGLRGAARYYSERYRPAFALECSAIKKVREQLGFANVIVMIPFCRTPTEADRVLDIMAANKLVRGEQGLEVYVMCEIPSNVILADEFAQRFDGFSIGSNDLTQLVLGVDRDSAELAYLFDARDPAVKRMISQVIKVAHQYGCKIGICGQAPSDHPDFAEFLVEAGIDSISLNPDSITRTIPHIAAAEKRLQTQRK